LSNDERNLLSVAYKNSVKTRRDAWRTIQAVQNKEELKVSNLLIGQGNKFLPLITLYKEKIETELKNICQDVLDLLDNHLIPKSLNPEAIVFF
jgi:14-3-3 protein epsilon